jgi:hypothetical protein
MPTLPPLYPGGDPDILVPETGFPFVVAVVSGFSSFFTEKSPICAPPAIQESIRVHLASRGEIVVDCKLRTASHLDRLELPRVCVADALSL